MPRKCCVPLCKSNYESTGEYVTVFKFPSDSDMREKWKKCIQRKEWSPTKNSVVCRRHFLPSDMILFNQFTDKSGVEQELPRRYPILKPNAYPSVFSELATCFELPQTRKVPEKLSSKIVSRYKNKTSEWLSLDNIQDFQTLQCQITAKLKDLLDKNWKMYTVTEGTSCCLVLYTISVKADIAPSIAVSVKVLPDMCVEVYLENKRVACKDLDWILTKSKLKRWSQLENLLIHYMETDLATSPKSVSDLLKDACSSLDLARELLLSSEDTNVQTTEKQLMFITEQLQLINKSEYGNMESQSNSSSNNIKLEPDSETDGVDSSDTEVENEMPASAKIEHPEVYIDCPDQEMNPSFESYPSISTQEHSQLEMFGSIENVKHELSDSLCEDNSFGKVLGLTGCEIIPEKTKNTSTEGRFAVRDHRASLKDNHCQVSDSGLSVSAVNDKQLLINENDQLDNVDTILKHTQTCVKHLDEAVGHDSSSSQRMQNRTDVCDSVSVKRRKRTNTVENPYECDECGASFTTNKQMNSHKKTHKEEKPYKFGVCEASYTTSQHLKYHNIKHAGEKPYKCDECETSFTEAASLKCHKRTHTGEKLYKCEDCSASFTKNTSLNNHKRRHQE